MTLETTIKQLPDSAGIYQYFDKDGRLLYIGKAKNLSKRVKSYFSFNPVLSVKAKLSPRITKMINQTISLNYIVVNSEHDALILENSLIKQLNPKYNILLRDDKTYPYIYIDNSQNYPRYEITRKIIKSKDIKYYGPYSVGARDILDSIYELCKLVQKKGCLKSKKLCLYHQIDKCLGPCELNISKDTYRKEVQIAQELIENKNILIKKLQEKMLFYSQEMRFEEALELRDRIERISKSEIKSDIDFASNENYDIFSLEHTDKKAVIVKIFMRNGKIISSSHEYINLNEGFDASEIYQRAILNFYGNNRPPILAQILIANDFESKYIIEKHLSELFGKKTPLQVPKIGSKKHLIDLALLNAKELLKKDKIINNEKLLLDTKELLNLQRIPSRVEVFDNSHMSGMATVGAMIVWQENAFDKASYRTYHLEAKDEYAQMRETLTRRVKSFSKISPPDLWIIDGGSTLLKLASEILESNGIFLDVIAISKEKIDTKIVNSSSKVNLARKSHRAKGKANDILHTLNKSFKLANTDKRLQWAQNLRDEAHRSAITFHKKTKLKLDQESQLLSLKGISQAKVIKLLKHFESFEALKKTSLEDISEVLNTKDAKIIKSIYN